MSEVRWERLTAPELRALASRDALVVLPVAALEQHGPHLPTWTDSQIGQAVAVRAAEQAGDVPAVVLPPLWLGLSEHHLPFGGTISLDYTTFHAVLCCICRSLRADGFRRLFLVNSHGGNTDALAVSARELGLEFAMPVVATSLPKLAPVAVAQILERQSSIRHACEAETSIWLATDPAQVRRDQVEAAYSEQGLAIGEVFDRAVSFAQRSPETGVRGDPRAATAEKGEKLVAVLAAALAAAMRDASLWTVPDPVWAPDRATHPAGR